jgi:hypothetical protein
MEIKDLLKPAIKKLDLTKKMGALGPLKKLIGAEEYVTMRRYP